MSTNIIDATTIIPAAKVTFRRLGRTIFTARDFSDVDKEIRDCVKLWVGLKALNQDIQSTQSIDRQRILVTLNHICLIYNPQMQPTF